jgi:hypothetical protein
MISLFSYVSLFISIALLSGVLLLILFWCFSMAKVVLLTIKYEDMYPCPVEIVSMCGDADYIRVLKHTETSAEVYYVDTERTVGSTAIFAFQNGNWLFQEWRTIWSSTGSSSEYVWPFFYHSTEATLVFIIIGLPILVVIIVLFLLPAWITNSKESN